MVFGSLLFDMKIAIILLAVFVAAIAASDSSTESDLSQKDEKALQEELATLNKWKDIAQKRIENARNYIELGTAVRAMEGIKESIEKVEQALKRFTNPSKST
ncbi:Hypothetical protein NTJ_13985 [Nesidiocoris tenuis]|uniref:Uncharacterized protein n=1 Tax=Nesidiocoris tenuis TaxID=355587 RepID=A0ABN7BA74_9HEMI|nr:Hypothetical protein NTJ_13985 [Nesidiocoris tenuis]